MAYGIEADIQKKVDAYKGNPQALEQQYAQKQELIDLLALQKIKSEKEAAARQMQLQMAQQQAAQGKPPTIKDQREQEVLAMTKQELVQQQGELMQQQAKEQQQGLQSLMQQKGRAAPPVPQMPQGPRAPQANRMAGIASRPAPNMARMAGGGIVAFAGDTDGSYVKSDKANRLGLSPEEVEANRLRGLIRKQYQFLASPLGRFGAPGGFSKEAQEGRSGFAAKRAEAQSILERLPSMSLEELQSLARTAVAPADSKLGVAVSEAADVAQDVANAADAGPAPAAPVAAPAAAPAAPAGPAAAPAPILAPQANQGIGGLPRPRPQAATSNIDPFAKQKAEEARVSGILGLTDAQRAAYEQNTQQLRDLYKEEMDPEERRKRELNAFLTGAANRSSIGSVMAGGAAGAESERRRNFASRLKGTEDIQKKIEDVIGIERGAKKEGIVAGQKIGDVAKDMRGQDLLTQDKALDRVVEEIKVRAQTEYNKAIADQTNAARLSAVLQNINSDIARAEAAVFKRVEDRLATLKMQIQGEKDETKRKKLEAELKKEHDELRLMTEAATESMRKQRDEIQSKLVGGDTGGFTVKR